MTKVFVKTTNHFCCDGSGHASIALREALSIWWTEAEQSDQHE